MALWRLVASGGHFSQPALFLDSCRMAEHLSALDGSATGFPARSEFHYLCSGHALLSLLPARTHRYCGTAATSGWTMAHRPTIMAIVGILALLSRLHKTNTLTSARAGHDGDGRMLSRYRPRSE